MASIRKLAETLGLDYQVLAEVAGGNEPPVDVQARDASAAAAAAATEIAELRARGSELEADRALDEERLRTMVDAMVAARLAEAAATGGAPSQPDERHRGDHASAS
jgi:hypothetical protein